MNVEKRLEILEKDLKKTKVINHCLLGVLTLVVFLGVGSTAFPKSKSVIRANGISIEDENGKSRIGLGMTKYGPCVALFGEDEKTVASLSVTRGGPALSIFDDKGNLCAALGTSKEGNMMVLFDKNNIPRVLLQMTDAPNMALCDEGGKPFWTAH